MEKDPTNEFYITEKRFVDEICAKHENLVNEMDHGKDDNDMDSKYKNMTSLHAQPVGHEDGDLKLSGDDLHYYLADLGYSCDEMMLRCHFEGRLE